MSMRLCPNIACRRSVDQTARRNIAGHYTPDGAPCPASGQDYTLTLSPKLPVRPRS